MQVSFIFHELLETLGLYFAIWTAHWRRIKSNLAHFLGAFQLALESQFRHLFVTEEMDVIDLYLLAFIYNESEKSFVCIFYVRRLINLDIHTHEAFLNIVFADIVYGRETHVIRYHPVLEHAHLITQLIAFILLYAFEFKIREHGSFLRHNFDPDITAFHFGDEHIDVGEHVLCPQPVDGLGEQVTTRECHFIPNSKSGNRDHDGGIKQLGTSYLDFLDHIFLGHLRVKDIQQLRINRGDRHGIRFCGHDGFRLRKCGIGIKKGSKQ